MNQRVTRRRNSGPTIIEVASHAGVSPMTVSRVVNGEANVSEATRTRVTLSISELGYSPNAAARSLASARSLRIGLLYSNPSAAYLSEFLLGGLDQCSRSGVELVVEKCDAEDNEQAAIDHMIQSGVDGVILPPPLCDSRTLVEGLAAAGMPTVVVATGQPVSAASGIRIDDREAAETMTRHLIAIGHRRIGFVKGHPNQTASRLRLEGYQAALAAAGLPIDPALIVQGYFTYLSGLEAADALLNRSPAPTAIFASNDDMAAAAVAAAHRRGLDVPRDLTVCGFDDTALATSVWPELTTIRQPVADMSRRAVLLLLNAVRRKSEGKPPLSIDEVTSFTFIRRQSDGAPRVDG